jgi:site-specific DNA recombinase
MAQKKIIKKRGSKNQIEKNVRAALYVRVSTEAQREEGYSIEAQKEMLEAYCKTKQIRSYEFYIDGGFSGSTVDRPELQRLIQDVETGEVNCVVVYKLDRLSRSQKDTLYLIEDVFNPHGADFVSLNENLDTSTPIGRAMLGIMSAFAQLERETIFERTRMGMRERVKSGLWMGGGKIPFGYDYDSEKGILVPNEDAKKVRQVYELYLRGYSFMRIARLLDLKYERLAEQILLRRTNTGVIRYKGDEYQGRHTPIISEETYEAALELYRKRSKKNLTTAKCLLAGLIICGVCGSKMRYQKWGNKGYKIYCYSQDSGKRHLAKTGEPCGNIKLWADELESVVIDDLFSVARERIENEDGVNETDITETLKKQYDNTYRQLKALYNLYAESEDRTLLETINEKREDLDEIKKRLENESERENEADRNKEFAEEITGLREAWEYMTNNEKQALLRRCIEKIVITGEKTDIYYNF